MRSLSRVCVYCGSSDAVSPSYKRAARDLGAYLVREGLGVVYGGGSVGLMNEVADSALAAGGEVIGVIPEKLLALELGRDDLTELRVVQGMHARKLEMATLSDAFVALPGGYGTLEELFEVTTWTQLEYHAKPVGLLNVDGYYDHLLAFIEHAAVEGFIRPIHRDLICVATTPEALLEQLRNKDLPVLDQWLR